MEIRINTSESDTDEYTALIALLASLGGRLPATHTDTLRLDVKVDTTEARAKLAALAGDDTDISTGADDGGATEDPADDSPYSSPEVAVAVGNSAVDSKGTPWDSRIHSESRATVADGSWRKRRGVSDETFAEVMTELAALIMQPDDEDDAPPPPPADDTVPLAPSDEQVPAPPAPTESPTEPAASAPVAGDPQTNGGQFADFASFVAAVSKHGKTYAELNEMAGVVGVAAFKDLKDHADKWDMFFSMIG